MREFFSPETAAAGDSAYQRFALRFKAAVVCVITIAVILLFLETWNEFIFALVFLQDPKLQTIPVAIAKIAGGKYIVPLGTYGASIMITVIPVLIIFIIFQKWFIAGMTMGALKG